MPTLTRLTLAAMIGGLLLTGCANTAGAAWPSAGIAATAGV